MVASNGALTVDHTVRATDTLSLRTVDFSSSGQDIAISSTGSVESTDGTVFLNSGDNITLEAGSQVTAAEVANLKLDYFSRDAAGGLATIGGSITAVDAVVQGGGQGDRLLVTSSPSGGSDIVWNITGRNLGNVENAYRFESIESLTSGNGNDQFVFADRAGITGLIDGVSGTNWLDYSAYTSSVSLDLQANANHIGSVANVHHVLGGLGDDHLTGDNSSNTLLGGAGNDTLRGASAADFLVGGLGNDDIQGEGGNDVIFGGAPFGTLADYTVGTSDFELLPGLAAIEDAFSSNPANFGRGVTDTDPVDHADRHTIPAMSPAILAGLSLPGEAADGNDTILGGTGADVLFGGSEVDSIDGEAGNDYIDAGAGDDIDVTGGDDNDLVRGGAGNDVLHGAFGIDTLLGDEGDDSLFGDRGHANGDQAGQRLLGGPGDDMLFAYGEVADGLPGDQLFGGDGADLLRGNLRSDLLVGGSGDDTLQGDGVTGANHAPNIEADVTGSADILFGDAGSDQVFGGGGDDELWGGSNNDLLDGQDGQDKVYGGLGIDLFVLPLHLGSADVPQAGAFADEFHGHGGNRLLGDIADDNATDILIVNGSELDDGIFFSDQPEAEGGRLRIDYLPDYTNPDSTTTTLFVDMYDAAGRPRVEKVQAAGLRGDDYLGFLTPFTTLPAGVDNPVALGDSLAIDRPLEFIGALDGNSGNDVLIGSAGRDQLNGGIGSDVLFGLAGDDRLYGDRGGEGTTADIDIIYAGQGNDDVLGGSGTNQLFAWSFDPSAGGEFGVFVDPADPTGQLFENSNGGEYIREFTGLNRLLGGEADDSLFGGTGLDFMYGRGLYSGSDTSYLVSGSELDFYTNGPLNPNDIYQVANLANIVIDHSALGTPANRFGDINGDGNTDLLFFSTTSDRTNLRIVFGGPTAGGNVDWPRQWNAEFVTNVLNPANSREIALGTNQLQPSGVNIESLNFNGDLHDDVLINSTHSITTFESLDPQAHDLDDVLGLPLLGEADYNGNHYWLLQDGEEYRLLEYDGSTLEEVFFTLPLSLPYTHGPANSNSVLRGGKWDIQGDGRINDGGFNTRRLEFVDGQETFVYHFQSDAYDGGMRLSGFPTSSSAVSNDFIDAGFEAIIGPANVSGLEITRKIHLYDQQFGLIDNEFIRYLDVLHNPTNATINFTFQIDTNLGSDFGTQLIKTTNGNTILSTSDNWLITDDADTSDGDPAVGHLFDGPGGIEPATVTLTDDDDISYTYNLNIPSGQTQIIMHYAVQDSSPDLRALEAGTYFLRVAESTNLGVPSLNYDAAAVANDGTPLVWESGVASHNANMGASAQIVEVQGDPRFSHAYQIGPGAGGVALSINDLSGSETTQSASLEAWFRPADVIGNEVIWETGGTGSGTSINIEEAPGGFRVLFATQNGANNHFELRSEVISNVSRFTHVVSIFNRPEQTLQLYVNGRAVGDPVSTGGDLNDWDGGDEMGIGRINSGHGGGSGLSGFGSFIGEIATLRFYPEAVSPALNQSIYPDFTVQVSPPVKGHTHADGAQPDRDWLDGGDGDDRIVGNYELDRIFGGSGADVITAEPIEVRDRDIADATLQLPSGAESTIGNPPLIVDPAIVIEDDGLRIAVSQAVDIPVTEGSLGSNRATVSQFTGGDVGEGLDLDGNFLYAVNAQGPAVGEIRDADFTVDTAPGVTLTAQNEILNWFNPSYGNTLNDNRLETVMQSIRWSVAPENSVDIDLANLSPGESYKLQLLFAEQSSNRAFDVTVEGVTIARELYPHRVQGGIKNTSAGAVLTYEFTASNSILDILLSNAVANAGGIDRHPVLQGFTLEQLDSRTSSPVFHDEIYATAAGGVTSLDASRQAIAELGGLEQMTNLVNLDLSRNHLTGDDLQAITPLTNASGQQTSLSNLQTLDLSDNPALEDIFALRGMTSLRQLHLEGTGLNPEDTNLLDVIRTLTNLEVLTLPGLPSQNLIIHEADSVQIVHDSGTLQFTAIDNGEQQLTIGGTQYTFFVRNVAPSIESLPSFSAEEGQQLTIGPRQLTYQPDSTASGLLELWYGGVHHNVNIDPLDPNVNPLSLLNETPGVVNDLDTALNFDNAQLDSRNGSVAGPTNFAGLWLGAINIGAAGSGEPLEAGEVTFGTSSDDGSLVYVDLNQNGIFESSEIVVDNRGSHGVIDRVGTLTLAEGTYSIAIPYFQGIGGGSIVARYGQGTVSQGNIGTLTVIDPFDAAQAGLWSKPEFEADIPLLLDGTEVDRITVSDPAVGDQLDLDTRVAIVNPARVATDITQRALSFTGEEHLALSDATLNGLRSLTTTFWLSTTNTATQTIFSGANATSDNAFDITLVDATTLSVSFATDTHQFTIAPVADGAYHHFVIVRSEHTNAIEVYVDSVPATPAPHTVTPLLIDSDLVAVGQKQLAEGDFAFNQGFVGNLDELSLWNQPFAPEHVEFVFTQGVPVQHENIIGYWPFNEGSGTIAVDLSSQANDGVVTLTEFSATTSNYQVNALAQGPSLYVPLDDGLAAYQDGVSGRFIRVKNVGNANRHLHIGEIEAFLVGVTPAAGLDAANDQALTSLGASFESFNGPFQHGTNEAPLNGAVESGGAVFSLNPGNANEYVLDLGTTRQLGSVRVWQRGDGCCDNRLQDVNISILADDGTGNPGAEVYRQTIAGQVPTGSFSTVTVTRGAENIVGPRGELASFPFAFERPAVQATQPGRSFDFDGTNDKLDFGYDAAYNAPSFSASLWAKMEGGQDTFRSPLTSRDGPSVHGYILYANPANRWEFWTGDGNGWGVVAGPELELNQWTHLAITFDAISGPDANGIYTGTKSLYVNGVLAGSATQSYEPNTIQPLRIGAGATEGPGGFFFDGDIDNVAIYDRAITASEVAAHYASRNQLGHAPTWTDVTPAAAAPYTLADDGTYTLQVTTSDGDGGTTYAQTTFDAVNLPPEILGLSGFTPRNTPEIGKPLTFDASATIDPSQLDRLTFLWEVTNNNGQPIATSSESSFSFTPLYSGSYLTTLTVTDDDGGSSTSDFAFTLDPIARVREAADSHLVFGATADGADDAVLLPANVVEGQTDFIFEFELRVDDAATASRIVQIDSGNGTSALLVDLLAGGSSVRIRTDFSGSGSTTDYTVALGQSISDGFWRRLSLIRSATTNSLSLLINDQLVGERIAPQPLLPLEGVNRFVLGRDLDTQGVGLHGALDNFRVWQADDPNGLAAGNSNLVAHWTFNELPGSAQLVNSIGFDTNAMLAGGNLAPTRIREEAPLEVGSLLTFDATRSTPLAPQGPLRGDTRSVRREFAWNSSPAGTVVGGNANEAFQFIPTTTGQHTVTLTITDVFETVDAAGNVVETTQQQDLEVASFSIAAEPLVGIELSGPATPTEGAPLQLTSQGLPALPAGSTREYQWQVTSSTGQSIPAGNSSTFAFTPFDNGTFTAALTVIDHHGSQSFTRVASPLAITVVNAVLTLEIGGGGVLELGTPIELTAAFTDAGLDDTFSYTIDWGDGTTPDNGVPPVVAAGTTATGEFTGSHDYLAEGNFTITVTLTDDDGQAASQTLQVLDQTRPTVAITPVTPDPRNTVVGVVDIDFSEAVVGFTLDDMTLSRNGSDVDLTGATLLDNGNGSFQVDLTSFTLLDGSYQLAVAAAQDTGLAIADSAGNLLTGSATETWLQDRTAPTATLEVVAPNPRNTSLAVFSIAFSEAVTNFDLTDLLLSRNGNNIPLTTAILSTVDNRAYTLELNDLATTEGNYIVTLSSTGSGIEDLLQNELSGPALTSSFTIDHTNPAASIDPITPDPRNIDAGTATIRFNEPVTGLDSSDLRLTRNGAGVDLSGLTVATINSSTYTIDLSAVTTSSGVYELRLNALDAEVFDWASNPLNVAATTNWTTDTTTPTGAFASIATPRNSSPSVGHWLNSTPL